MFPLQDLYTCSSPIWNVSIVDIHIPYTLIFFLKNHLSESCANQFKITTCPRQYTFKVYTQYHNPSVFSFPQLLLLSTPTYNVSCLLSPGLPAPHRHIIKKLLQTSDYLVFLIHWYTVSTKNSAWHDDSWEIIAE